MPPQTCSVTPFTTAKRTNMDRGHEEQGEDCERSLRSDYPFPSWDFDSFDAIKDRTQHKNWYSISTDFCKSVGFPPCWASCMQSLMCEWVETKGRQGDDWVRSRNLCASQCNQYLCRTNSPPKAVLQRSGKGLAMCTGHVWVDGPLFEISSAHISTQNPQQRLPAPLIFLNYQCNNLRLMNTYVLPYLDQIKGKTNQAHFLLVTTTHSNSASCIIQPSFKVGKISTRIRHCFMKVLILRWKGKEKEAVSRKETLHRNPSYFSWIFFYKEFSVTCKFFIHVLLILVYIYFTSYVSNKSFPALLS